MATIITAEKGLILTSGLKFCTLSTINGGTKNAELASTDESVEIQNIPNPLPRQDIQEVPQPIRENLRILCSAFSGSEKYVAFADDHKQLSLWEWQDNAGLKLIKQWNLMRRANKIIFDHCIRKEYLAFHSNLSNNFIHNIFLVSLCFTPELQHTLNCTHLN